MWKLSDREQLPGLLAQDWDIVVVGGGITGAGILLEASRRGLHALLVEQRDFAWGTSSRSSKLVHGGLRYLKEGKFKLTRDSVRERENLMREAPGLVDAQPFAFANYAKRKPGRWAFSLGLAIYDRMAERAEKHWYRREEFLMLAPAVGRAGLQGGLCYTDAKTDDARLVLRVLQEAVAAGGHALNYLAAQELDRHEGKVGGLVLRDDVAGARYRVRAKVVINATGAWADGLRQASGKHKLRPLRGSHLILPAWKLPLAQAISFMHPRDGRPVFAFPWEGATLVGTTDVDHREDLRQEAIITADEARYLMEALAFQFPQIGFDAADVISSYAGVRPVIDTGKSDPSKEGRDHAVWMEDGLLTVTGGKLTTFRLIALDALKQAAARLPGWQDKLELRPVFRVFALPRSQNLTATQHARLAGRLGINAPSMIAQARPEELQTIDGTETLWAELRWAARHEAVHHLEDLLLRRTRLGLLLAQGGAAILPRVRELCQIELAWNDARWEQEEADYRALWQRHYAPPEAAT
ncbi:MAG TPA: glycerol-3-phosphate dehydrogenase/oxidase [Burkholderiaceae bacterium]